MGKKPVILCVADELHIRESLGAILSSNEYEFLMAGNPAEAISKACERQPDLILLDLTMPGAEGMEAVRQLRTRPEIHAIPMLAICKEPDRCCAQEAGIPICAGSPIPSKALKTQVRDLLEEAAERRRIEIKRMSFLLALFSGFWISDREGRFLDVNDAYLEAAGYSREKFLKLNIQDIEAEADPAGIARRREEIVQAGSGLFETRHRRGDGSLLDVEVSVYYSDFRGGRFYAYVRDITGRKCAEEELKRSKESLEQQAWGLQKANESIKLLYEELEKKNQRLSELDQLKDNFISTVTAVPTFDFEFFATR